MSITTEVRNDLLSLVVGAFQAAPGTTLLNSLADQYIAKPNLAAIALTMQGTAEFIAAYPRFLSNQEFATRVVDNILEGRVTATERKWAIDTMVADLNKGAGRAELILSAVIELQKTTNPAWANAKNAFINQVEVAKFHTVDLGKDGTLAERKAIIADVDQTASSVTTAKAVVNAPVIKTFALTASSDTFAGDSSNDVINAPLGGANANTMTYSATDIINGGGGSDSLYVESNIAALNLSLVKSVESVSVNQTVAAGTVTLPTDKSTVALTNTGSTFGVTFNGVTNAATSLGLTSIGATTTTVGYSATALSGAADTLALNLNASTGATVAFTGSNTTTNNLENIAVNTAADSTATLDLTNTALKGITVAGSGATTLTVNNATADLTSINASAATGALTVTAPDVATALAITGGAGNDVITGGAGNDVITGGAGNDTITGGAGNDNIDAGAGDDRVVITALTKDDTIAGGEGTDTLSISGDIAHSTTSTDVQPGTRVSGFEAIRATAAASVDVTGLATNNKITSVIADGGNLTLTKDTTVTNATFLDTGRTISVASAGTQAVTIGQASGTAAIAGTLATGATTLNVGSANKLVQADQNTFNITGTTANASVATVNLTGANRITFAAGTSTGITKIDASGVTATAAAAAFAVTASAASATGGITFIPGAGTVSVTTGAGADSVTGTAGNDTFVTGAGNDTVNAGAGNDTVSSVSGNNMFDLGAGNDTATGGTGNDSITGGDGNDNITGNAGDDTLIGGEGNDVINGGDGNDSIVGGAGNDTLTDGAGNDTVLGGDGDDTINISTGNDSVDGGAGNDTITITGLSSGDTINGGEGTDRLILVNASTTTLTPTFTSIESLTAVTSTAFNLNLTDATDKTSLKSFNISASAVVADAASVVLTALASGSTVTVSDDNSWDGASTTDTDDTGDIQGSVAVGTVAGGSSTVVVAANIDQQVAVGTVFNGLIINKSQSTALNSTGGSATNTLTNSITSLALDNTETQSVTITAAAWSALTVGTVTNSAALQTFAVNAAAASGVTTSVGTIEEARSLTDVSLKSTGGFTTLTQGAIGAGVGGAAQITSLVVEAASGSTTTVAAVTSTSGTATATTVSVQAVGASSVAQTAAINLGTRAVTALTIGNSGAGSVVGTGSITSGAITTATVTLADLSRLEDASGGTTTATLNGAVTTLNATIGNSVTLTDNIAFSGLVTNLNVTANTGTAAIVLDSATNTLTIGGVTALDFANGAQATTKARLTYGGTSTAATVNWDGSNFGGGNTVTSGTGNDTLTGGSGNDVFNGGSGNDSLTGGAGIDVLTGGEGADTLNGGAGNDSIVLTESTSAADLVRIGTNATASDSPVVVVDGADTGADVISGFNFANDTIQIVATGVVNFVHTVHTKLGTATGTTVTSTAGAATVAELSTATVAVDITGAAADTAVSLGAGDIAFTLSSANNAGVALTATSVTAGVTTTGTLTEALVLSRMQYNLTGTDAANTITGGALADTITGGAGIDSLTGGAGADVFVLSGILATANRDVITDFVSATDKLTIAAADTTIATAAGATAITGTGTAVATNAAGTAAYVITGNNTAAGGATAITTANTDLIKLNVTAAGANSGNLALLTADGLNGTELLKALTDATAADTHTGITGIADSKGYIQATQGGVTYLYHYANDNNTLIVAAEIVLVGTFSNGAVLVAGDIILGG